MQNSTENKMGTMPVGKLLITMSVPTMFSMLIQALYNIVDSIFVSRVSEAALTAVSLAFPMQNLMMAFAVGTSIGICSVVSRRLGEKKEQEAYKAAATGYVLMLFCFLLFMILGLAFSRPFFSIYTDDPELLKMGTQYLSICLGASIGVFISVYCEKVLQGTGDTIHPMFIQISGAVFNVIFDPVFIFGYFGLPAMGVAGAAVATVLGQLLAMIIGLSFVSKNHYVPVRFFKFDFDKESMKDILEVGIPSIIMQGIGTLMTSLMNGILIAYDVLATTAFGVYFKLQSFVFLPVFGLNAGLLPILGYNFGARNKQRFMHTIKLGVVIAVIIMTFGMMVFNFFPDVLMKLFNASDSLLAIGRITLRKCSLSFPLAAITIMLGSVFQATGDGYFSMITSIVRQIGILIPASFVFGKLFGLDNLWFSFVFAEVFALSLNVFFFIKENKMRLNF